MDCEIITKQYLTRFIRTINGTSNTSNTLILILQNPAEPDDIDDKTTIAIKKVIGHKYKTIIILNIIALVGKKLEDIPFIKPYQTFIFASKRIINYIVI